MKPKIIIAGPGTGKTFRIIRLVRESLENPTNNMDGFILCTFTRKAAEELQIRLFESIDPSQISNRTYLIDTIHSISLTLLKLHQEGKYADFEVIPDDQHASYINGKLPRLGFDRDEYKGSDLWNLCSDIASIYGYITDRQIEIENFDFSSDPKLETIIMHYPIYRKLLLRDKKFDFAVVQSTLLENILVDPPFKLKVNEVFKTIFVDEYQDTNPIQHTLLLALAEPDFRFTVVGDDDQSIYGFRGASVENLLGLPNFFKMHEVPYELEFLSDNHRSTHEIVQLSRDFILKSKLEGFNKDIVSVRGASSIMPIVNEYEQTSDEAIAIAKCIQELKESNSIDAYSQVGILLRTSKNRATDFSRELEKSNIPFKLIGVGDFFELQLVKEFMAILSYIFDVSTSALDNFKNELDQIGNRLSSIYFDDEIVLKIQEIKDKWRNYKSSIAITYDLLTAARFFERFDSQGKNLGQLTQIIMSHDENIQGLDLYGVFSFMSFLRREKMIDSLQDQDSDAVQIMTIHKAKGLEFDAVFLPAQNQLNPSSNIVDRFKDITSISSNNDADELRLFYVGMTRARNFLWISRSRKSKTGKKIYTASSGFELVSSSKDLFVSSDFFQKNEQLTAYPRKVSRIPILSYNQIHTYEICPKQYMYRNEWMLETARNAGMNYGTNLHAALQMINAEIANGQIASSIDLNPIIEKSWKSNWRTSEVEDSKFKTTAISQLELYLKNYSHYFDLCTISGIERQFDITVENTLITGRFDLILNQNGKNLIIDFKTGDKRDYSFQLNFYEYCLQHEFPNDTIDSAVYYLNSGLVEKTNKIESEQIEFRILDTKEQIEKKNFNPTPGEHCVDCSFNKICLEGLSWSKSKI